MSSRPGVLLVLTGAYAVAAATEPAVPGSSPAAFVPSPAPAAAQAAAYECPYHASDGALKRVRKRVVAHGTGFGYRREGSDTLVVTNQHVSDWPAVTDDGHPVDGVPTGCKRVSDSLRIVDNESDSYERDDIALTRVVADAQLDLAVQALLAKLVEALRRDTLLATSFEAALRAGDGTRERFEHAARLVRALRRLADARQELAQGAFDLAQRQCPGDAEAPFALVDALFVPPAPPPPAPAAALPATAPAPPPATAATLPPGAKADLAPAR